MRYLIRNILIHTASRCEDDNAAEEEGKGAAIYWKMNLTKKYLPHLVSVRCGFFVLASSLAGVQRAMTAGDLFTEDPCVKCMDGLAGK